jgi:hypothetical protein
VYKVDNNVFANCVNLQSIILSTTIIMWGSDVFLGSNNITRITINAVDGYVYGMHSYIYKRLTNDYGSNVVKLIEPENINDYDIDDYVNTDNIFITRFTLPALNTLKIDPIDKYPISSRYVYQYYDSVKNDNIVAKIPNGGKPYILFVNISYQVEHIENSLFSGCSSLFSVTIPNSVKQIEASAFSGCVSLPSVTIPNSVHTVGDSAFASCNNLQNITLSTTIISWGNNVFSGCDNITITLLGIDGVSYTTSSYIYKVLNPLYGTNGTVKQNVLYIEYPETTTEYNEYLEYTKRTDTIITSTEIANIPTPTKEYSGISRYVYTYSALTSGTISITPANKKYILFVNVPDGVTEIDSTMFSGFTNLLSITIPSNIIIDSNAFSGCYSLTRIYIRGNPTTEQIQEQYSHLVLPEGVEIDTIVVPSSPRITEATYDDSTIYLQYENSEIDTKDSIQYSEYRINGGEWQNLPIKGGYTITHTAETTFMIELRQYTTIYGYTNPSDPFQVVVVPIEVPKENLEQKIQTKKKRVSVRDSGAVIWRKKMVSKIGESKREVTESGQAEKDRQEKGDIWRSVRRVRSLGSVVPPKCVNRPGSSGVRNYGESRKWSEKPDENTDKTKKHIKTEVCRRSRIGSRIVMSFV